LALELRDIHKTFREIRANDGVTLTIEGGAIFGLLGENGAGKSTLMKILSGYISADSGEVVLEGHTLTMSSPRDAIDAGIGMLHQDPLVFLPFSVVDNLLLGSSGRIDRNAGIRALAEMRERYGFTLEPDVPVRNLTVGERQQLEIARLLRLRTKVLILDEPTTGISADQRTTLFATLRTLASEGMTVIFVSHKLEEVEEICQEIAVMRRGSGRRQDVDAVPRRAAGRDDVRPGAGSAGAGHRGAGGRGTPPGGRNGDRPRPVHQRPDAVRACRGGGWAGRAGGERPADVPSSLRRPRSSRRRPHAPRRPRSHG